MRNDWETPPTVEGLIVRAWTDDGRSDVLHVQGVDVSDDIGNLLRLLADTDTPDIDRPFLLAGRAGMFAKHGYTDPARMIGKRCLIYSGGRFDVAAIEPEDGDHWGLVTWREYV